MLVVSISSFSVLSAACTSFKSEKPPIVSIKQQFSANKPFPQHTVYTARTIKPNHITQDQLDNDVKRIYDEWKGRYLVQHQKDPNQYYVFYNLEKINEPKNAVSCSEGHGYGMLATALMAGYDDNAKVYFDGMYRFYKAHPSINDPGLMAWQQIKTSNGDIINTPPSTNDDGNRSATDGDMDIAYALLLADKQWGSIGEIDYLNESKTIINAIMEKDVNSDEWILKLGDWANNSDSTYGTGTRSSDFMLSHLKVFQAATGNTNWGKVKDKTYSIINSLNNNQSSTTGLLPDFSFRQGNGYTPANPNYLEKPYDGYYYYNSSRIPWRIPIDYLLSGDTHALKQISTLNGWIQSSTGGKPSNINAGYKLDGSEISEEEKNVMAFIAPFAVSAMVDSSNQEWLNTLWTHMTTSPTDNGNYFGNSIRLLVMITVSGNWWKP